ncbi:hypothetical protein BV378_20615 [Nostoc sp. RF31YmG]|nr:hypothetical protein BV378_20615 [Nostoc sp. RF31YmG]
MVGCCFWFFLNRGMVGMAGSLESLRGKSLRIAIPAVDLIKKVWQVWQKVGRAKGKAREALAGRLAILRFLGRF